MDLKEYQQGVEDTWISNEHDIERILLGIFGEVGEIAEAFKKFYREDYGKDELIKKVRKEIGDAQYYLVKLSNYLEIDFSKILEENNTKLKDRKNRGVLKGSGDSR